MLTSKNINQLIMKYQLKTVYINYKLMRRDLPKLHKTKTYQSEKLILLELEKQKYHKLLKKISCKNIKISAIIKLGAKNTRNYLIIRILFKPKISVLNFDTKRFSSRSRSNALQPFTNPTLNTDKFMLFRCLSKQCSARADFV